MLATTMMVMMMVMMVMMVASASMVEKNTQGILQETASVDVSAFRFQRYCLNALAPPEFTLSVAPEDVQFCNTYRQEHADAAGRLTVAAQTPQPPVAQQWKAIRSGDQAIRTEHPNRDGVPMVLLEKALSKTRQSSPGKSSVKWPTTDIPFSLDATLTAVQTTNILWGINHIERRTCIRFAPVTPDESVDHIHFQPHATDCSSHLGKTIGFFGHKHVINVASWCGAGSIAHELMHALGFDHTHNRLDRDNYVNVDKSNVKWTYSGNYDKQSSPFQDYGPYDFQSILHYPADISDDWASDPKKSKIVLTEKTGRPATVPAARNSPWDGTRQRIVMTTGDAEAVQAIYCSSAPVPSATGINLANPTGTAPALPVDARPSGNALTQVKCLTNNDGENKIYVKADGNCKRTTTLSCGANSECIPDGSCAGDCVCGRDYINTCQCVRAFNPATEVCQSTSGMF